MNKFKMLLMVGCNMMIVMSYVYISTIDTLMSIIFIGKTVMYAANVDRESWYLYERQ